MMAKKDQTRRAIAMMRRNSSLSVPEVAKKVGVSHTTIYRSPLYEKLLEERKEKPQQ